MLRKALALSEYKNFARAAEQLGISQPTLTRAIQSLEKHVGECLFDRGKKAVLPTQAGEIVLKHARMIIASSETMLEEINRHRGILEGSINIGAGSYVGSALLPTAIVEFSEKYPEIELSVSIDTWHELPARLMKKEFDFLVIDTSDLELFPHYDLIKLDPHQAFIICRPEHPLLKKPKLLTADLVEFPLIMSLVPQRIQSLFNRLLFPGIQQQTALEMFKHITCNDQTVIKSTVQLSNNIAIATYGMVANELKVGLLAVLPLKIAGLYGNFNIIRRKGIASSPAALSFIQVLREIDKQQSLDEATLIASLGTEISV